MGRTRGFATFHSIACALLVGCSSASGGDRLSSDAGDAGQSGMLPPKMAPASGGTGGHGEDLPDEGRSSADAGDAGAGSNPGADAGGTTNGPIAKAGNPDGKCS